MFVYFSLLVLLATTAYVQSECPFVLADNIPCYELKANYCYCFSFIEETWAEATLTCRTNSALNARLVSIESSDEQQIIEDHLRETPGLSLLQKFWTSASDSQIDGAWLWTSNGDLVSGYSNWREGFDNTEAEDCMVVDQPSGYYWDDAVCSAKFNFICEGAPVAQAVLN